jgi:hypothetical protein
MPEPCKKCGGKVDPKGNYCTECLEPVYSAKIEDIEEERKPLPMKAIFIGAGAFLVVAIALIFVLTRPLPPEKVAQKWVDRLVSYQVEKATEFTTSRYEMSNPLGGGRKSSYEKADEFKDVVDNQDATYKFSAPQYLKQKPPVAIVKVTFSNRDGDLLSYNLGLVRQKDGRWLIDRVD